MGLSCRIPSQPGPIAWPASNGKRSSWRGSTSQIAAIDGVEERALVSRIRRRPHSRRYIAQGPMPIDELLPHAVADTGSDLLGSSGHTFGRAVSFIVPAADG